MYVYLFTLYNVHYIPVGVNVEGLFRVPGPAQHIEELRKEFEEGEGLLLSAYILCGCCYRKKSTRSSWQREI